MTEALLVIALLVILLWLGMAILYVLVSRQQPNLRRQLRSLEEQLDDQDGRALTGEHF